jgi:hypothetical protein
MGAPAWGAMTVTTTKGALVWVAITKIVLEWVALEDFSQTTDVEVRNLLARTAHEPSALAQDEV